METPLKPIVRNRIQKLEFTPLKADLSEKGLAV